MNDTERSEPWATETERMDRELWLALVRPSHGTAWIDLSNGRWLVTPINTPPEAWHDDSARYISVPPVPQEDMRAWAVDFARAQGHEALARTAADLALEDWFAPYLKLLPSEDLRAHWLEHHRSSVLRRWRDWCAQHDLHPRLGMRHSRPTNRKPKKVSPPAPRREAQLEELRALVHAAIDRMSEDELLSLRIPLRYVLSTSDE